MTVLRKRDNCDLDLKNIYISPTSPSLDKNFHKCADNIPILGSNAIGVRQTLLEMKKRLSGIAGHTKATNIFQPPQLVK